VCVLVYYKKRCRNCPNNAKHLLEKDIEKDPKIEGSLNKVR